MKTVVRNNDKSSNVDVEHKENNNDAASNLFDQDVRNKPEVHWRTYVAVASMCLLQFVQFLALIGKPPAVDICIHPIRYDD